MPWYVGWEQGWGETDEAYRRYSRTRKACARPASTVSSPSVASPPHVPARRVSSSVHPPGNASDPWAREVFWTEVDSTGVHNRIVVLSCVCAQHHPTHDSPLLLLHTLQSRPAARTDRSNGCMQRIEGTRDSATPRPIVLRRLPAEGLPD